jgi:DNA-binding LytR/AlgR family response regulator
MNIMLIDDEKIIVEELKYILEKFNTQGNISAYENVEEFMKDVEKKQPDAIFIDINLGMITGFDVAEQLLKLNKVPLIVFATAYDDYAIKAFEYGAIDYILKPFDENRLKITMERIKELLKNKSNLESKINSINNMLSTRKINKLTVLTNGRFKVIPFDKIYFIKAKQGISEVTTSEGTFMCESNLSQLESKLGEKFLRIHKSYIINIDKIAEVIPWFKGTYWVVLSDDNKTEIPVSKEKIKEIKEIIF